MSRFTCSLFFMLGCLSFTSAQAQTPTPVAPAPSLHPRVLGFERFHAQGEDAVAGGMLLLGELNCVSCHASSAAEIVKKQAPVLDELANRTRPEYFARFLANPQAVKVGTSMPNVFAHLPEEEAKKNAEALAHFLSTTGKFNDSTPTRQAAIRGDQLFHTIGCTACHDARREGVKPFANSIPLGAAPSKKYTYPGMVKFLLDPHHARPSGRMPNMSLSADQAADLAAFLLKDLASSSSLDYAYYEGNWEKLPDFSKLKAKESGSAEKIDVSLAKQKDNFGLRFDGLIQIAKEGEYTVHAMSDDGSRVSIDGRVVVDNDGIHAPTSKSGKIQLTSGKHAFAVEYFEAGGGEEITVEIEGPELKRQPLHALLAAPEPPTKSDAPKPFTFNAELAEKGKQLFLTAGCASCHQLKQGDVALASSLKAPALAALKGEGGCVAEKPVAGTPFFAFNAPQRKAVTAAIAAVKQGGSKTLDLAASVHGDFQRFNCYGCHARGTIGGVEEERNSWFDGAYKTVGDEGRIPPQLSDVGAKLKPEWLKEVLEKGTKVRKNVYTHMPKFGPSNLGDLHERLIKADAGKIPPAPKVDIADTDKKFKQSGRFLVGAQGFGCIKCHTFNGKGTPGNQVMDLTVMSQRLNDGWFHAYMLNPPELRPGTRMPAAWPGGISVLPKVLGGDTPKQIRSIWAYLADAEKAQIPVGMVEAKIELLPIDEPIIYRNFIEGAGPRAIGVGYPEKVNLAWDANHMRLALVWQGAFIDASMHWVGRGPGYQKPLGDLVYTAPADAPLAKLDTADQAWPATSGRDEKAPGFVFKSYHLDAKRRPSFTYAMGDLLVTETPLPKIDGETVTLVRTLEFSSSSPIENHYFLAAAAGKIEAAPEKGWYTVGESLRIKIDSVAAPLVRQAKGRMELLVPVKLEGGKGKITQEFEW